MLLQGKTALVTGGASGLGKAIVKDYLEEGARVIATDINVEKLEIMQKEFQTLGHLSTQISDVGNRKSINELLELIDDKYGQLDILVNNAGVSEGMLPVAEVSDNEWDHTLAINLTGPFLLCRGVIEKFLAQKRAGCIINIASAAGIGGGRAGAAYVASKFGLVGLTKNIAYMYGPDNIRCNAICPGYVKTEISDLSYKVSEYGVARAMNGTKSIRVGEPKEISSIAVFLASDYASLINGETILADAGKGAY